MYCWQTTKYNPKYRNEKGHYLKEEWTFFTTSRTIVEGKKITFDELDKLFAVLFYHKFNRCAF